LRCRSQKTYTTSDLCCTDKDRRKTVNIKGSAMKSTDPADYQDTPRPFAGMAKDFPDGFRNEPHSHRRAQLTWAVSGVMTVTAAQGAWVVPPNRAVWIPGGTIHEIRMSGRVAMRALYVEPGSARELAGECKVIMVTPLLRELILEIVTAPLDYDETSRMGHVVALVLDEIRTLDAQPLHLPMPRDRRLRTVCEALLRDPARAETLEAWSDTAGGSSRTLARLFAKETGMRFVDWRRQARLAAALVRLASGQDVASVGRRVGYASPSAFTQMFRTALGKTPSEYFG
jgi:AraC-like DNA-binding protein/quercetin dioxygenase-like cupin family protein